MDNKELNEKLRKSAISCGLCRQWQREWKEDWDEETMFERFFKGLDFFLKYRFMSNDFLKKNFDITARRKHNVLIDDIYSMMNPEQALLVGCSESNIRFNGSNSGTLWITDKSTAKIIAKGRSFVIVHLLEQAQVEIKQKDGAKVAVILHSNKAVVTSDDDITIKYELDFLKDKRDFN